MPRALRARFTVRPCSAFGLRAPAGPLTRLRRVGAQKHSDPLRSRGAVSPRQSVNFGQAPQVRRIFTGRTGGREDFWSEPKIEIEKNPSRPPCESAPISEHGPKRAALLQSAISRAINARALSATPTTTQRWADKIKRPARHVSLCGLGLAERTRLFETKYAADDEQAGELRQHQATFGRVDALR